MLQERIYHHFIESADLKYKVAQELSEPVAAAAQLIFECVTNGNKLLICGNGGSAADAQHFSAEFVGRYEKERPELAAIALTTDTSILTAVANDYSFDEIFARQVRALGHADDMLVAISTSGNSANVVRAIEAALVRDMKVIALTGRDGGQIGQMLRSDVDIHLCVPYPKTARIQEVHLLMLHALCDAVDAMLLGDLDSP